MDGLSHRDAANVAPLVDSIRFPLRLRGVVASDIGRGPRVAEAVLAGGRVVVSRSGAVSGFTDDLGEEAWRLQVDGQASLIALDDRVFVATGQGLISELDGETGVARSTTTSGIPGSLGAVGSDVYIVRTPPGLTAVGRDDGRVRWKRNEASDVAGLTPEGKVLLFGLGREHIECVDERAGQTIWQFRPPGETLALLHDCAIVDDAVIAVFGDRRVFRLRLEDGSVIKHGESSVLGPSLIMPHAVAFALPEKLVEFDFTTMKDGNVVNFHAKVPHRPPAGLCVSRNAIVWTSDVGAVTGVTRTAGITEKRYWEAATHDWGFMQTAVNPFVGGRYLYLQPLGAMALVCFEMPEA